MSVWHLIPQNLGDICIVYIISITVQHGCLGNLLAFSYICCQYAVPKFKYRYHVAKDKKQILLH